MKTLTLTTLTAGLMVGTAANAAITYVDAVEGASGNTGVTGQPISDTSWVGPNSGSGGDLWNKRALGTNDSLFQALPSNNTGIVPDVPQLTTTISGLTDGGTYNIWVFFQDNVGDTAAPIQNWVISAGLDSSLDTTYWAGDLQALEEHRNNPPVVGATGTGSISQAGVFDANNLTFAGSGPITLASSGETSERRLYGVNLGEVTLSGETSVDVYVDMLIEGSSTTTRVFYDGVGYEVVPEPSSLALLGLGGLLVARRRRG